MGATRARNNFDPFLVSRAPSCDEKSPSASSIPILYRILCVLRCSNRISRVSQTQTALLLCNEVVSSRSLRRNKYIFSFLVNQKGLRSEPESLSPGRAPPQTPGASGHGGRPCNISCCLILRNLHKEVRSTKTNESRAASNFSVTCKSMARHVSLWEKSTRVKLRH